MRAGVRRDVDYFLIGLALAVTLFGLVAIVSATLHGSGYGVLRRQTAWAVCGVIVMLVVASTDYHVWTRWTNPLYAFNLLLLVAVLVFGHQALGAQRWLQLGPVQLQPSELAQLLVIFTLAPQLASRAGALKHWRDVLVPLMHVCVPAALVLLQPDLGTSLVFLAILLTMLYGAGFPGWRLAAGCGITLSLAVAAIAAHLRWHTPLPMKGYQLQRLIAFINPQADPLGAGYHILQSEIAVGSGRVVGLGFFGGAAGNQLSYLPQAHTDFIFAVIGHSVGFVGSAAILLALFLILWRGVRILALARDSLGVALAAGVVGMLAFHTVVNVGMTLGIMPVTGVPLPFTSYGGSALLVDYAGVGLLLSIYLRHRKIQF